MCAFCSIAYFVMISILQVYMMYLEKNIFYQGVEKVRGGGDGVWCFSSDMGRFDDRYTLSVTYRQGNSSGSAAVTKSVANYITEEGQIIVPALAKEVKLLQEKLSKENNKHK